MLHKRFHVSERTLKHCWYILTISCIVKFYACVFVIMMMPYLFKTKNHVLLISFVVGLYVLDFALWDKTLDVSSKSQTKLNTMNVAKADYVISPNCDLDLEDSQAISSHDTDLALGGTLPYQVWLQRAQLLRRHHQDKHQLIFWTFIVTLTFKTAVQSFDIFCRFFVSQFCQHIWLSIYRNYCQEFLYSKGICFKLPLLATTTIKKATIIF